jgi:hypothetical protein
MAFNIDDVNKFDIFISYSQNLHEKINNLYQLLSTKYDTSIYLSKVQETSQVDYVKNLNIIRNIKIFICCVTKSYLEAQKIRSAITEAYAQQKPILILMFESLKMQELSDIAFMLESSKILDVAIRGNWNWTDKLLDKIVVTIEDVLGKKLNLYYTDPFDIKKKKEKRGHFLTKMKATTKEKPKADKKTTTMFSGTVNKTELMSGGESVQTTTIITVATEELLDKLNVNNSENKLIIFDASFIKLRSIKSTLLLNSTFGFNRIKWINTKNRYMLTSSYTHVIVTIDEVGNLVEKKNPNKILSKPWALYFHKTNQEIYVGDNNSHLIFVFDTNLKFLRKFGENLFNNIFDMVIDEPRNDLFTVDMFEGLLQVISLISSKVKFKIYLNSPTFVTINETKIVVVSSIDLIYVIDKTTFQVTFTISMNDTKYISGIHIDSYENIYTTSYSCDDNDNKSKEVYLNVVNLIGVMETKRFNLGITQSTDFVINDNRLVIINDTNVDVFEVDFKVLRPIVINKQIHKAF